MEDPLTSNQAGKLVTRTLISCFPVLAEINHIRLYLYAGVYRRVTWSGYVFNTPSWLRERRLN